MREHIEQIIKTKWLFLMHIMLYVVFVGINVLCFFCRDTDDTGINHVKAAIFSIVFLGMLLVEVVTYIGTKRLFQYTMGEFWYRVFELIVFFVFYLSASGEIGSGAPMIAILLCYIELVFFFQPDDSGRRVMTYICMAIFLEVVTFWNMLHNEEFYEGFHLLISTNLLLVGMIALSETIIRIYYYFMHKLFAQNRTVENLNEANDKLMEQQNEIKKTNELLGLQKIELQAANKKINRSHDEMSLQNEIGSIITSTMDQEQLLQRICKIIKVRLDMDLVCILVNPDKQLEVPGEATLEQELYFSHTLETSYGERLREFLRSGKVDDLLELSDTYIQNTQTKEVVLKNRSEEDVMQSLMIIPLKKHSERIGSFIVGKRITNAFMENRAFYETIASQISIGISNKRLYEQMRQMAIRDGLTKIYNRRYLTEVLNEYLKEGMEKKTEVCLALFDIDKFKMVNDTYGHLCGDAVIRHVATLLNGAAFSHGGIAGRYGGEEFVIAFKNKPLSEVHEIIKNVHAQIREEEVHYEEKVLHVRASVGLASYPETCQNPAELLNRADWAMYHSKQHGRDQITVDNATMETKM